MDKIGNIMQLPLAERLELIEAFLMQSSEAGAETVNTEHNTVK